MSVEHELRKVDTLIHEAKKNDYLIKHVGMDLIFTPAGLIATIKRGSWHCCSWELVSKTMYGNRLRRELTGARKKYDAFVTLIEKG